MNERIRRIWLWLVAFVQRVVGQIPQFVETQTVQGRQAVRPSRLTIGRVARPVIGRSSERLWQSRGWTRADKQGAVWYEGHLRALDKLGRQRLFRGCCVESQGHISLYIADPPEEVRRHPKGPCFQLANTPWFRLHWTRPPEHVDHALAYAEKILCESLASYDGR